MARPRFRARGAAAPATPAPAAAVAPAATPPATPPAPAVRTPAPPAPALAPSSPAPVPTPEKKKEKKEKVGLLERTIAPPSIARSVGSGAAVLVGSIMLLGLVLAAVVGMSIMLILASESILHALN